MSASNAIAPARPPGQLDVRVAINSFEQFLGSSADVIEALGAFVANTGSFEKTLGASTQDMAQKFMETDIDQLLKAMGPSVAPLFVKVSLRLGVLGGTDIDKLTPDQKVAFGASMRDLANDMRRMLDALREAISKNLSP